MKQNIETIMATEASAPFHCIYSPHKSGQELHILVEAIIMLSHHFTGDLNPELFMISELKNRKLYLCMLPAPLIEVLIQMKAPKKFPDNNDTFHFIPWQAELERYWLTLAPPEGAMSISTTVLKTTLDYVLEEKGVHVAEIKKIFKTASGEKLLEVGAPVKLFTGNYHCDLNVDDNWTPTTEHTDRSLVDLKHVCINRMTWTINLSHTLTNKLKLCIECFEPLPDDHPMVTTPFTHLEQATGEDKEVAKNRMQLYIQKAKHVKCTTKSGKRASDGGGSSADPLGSLRALLAKRAKEPEN